MQPILRSTIVVSLIGVLSALAWVRLGLYGYGLPQGLVTLVPLAVALVLYVRTGRLRDTGTVLTGFGIVWLLFELRITLAGAFDPAVTMPAWSPFSLLGAAAATVAGIALLVRSQRAPVR